VLPRLELRTRLVLVMHASERERPTATGPLAVECLPNSALHVHGLRDQPVDLAPEFATGRRVLVLFPADDARPLDAVAADADPRPVTLVVPDGSWSQARRAARRVPGLADAERVTLPAGAPTEWGIRAETKEGGLSTFEAIARSLAILEGPEVEAAMMPAFRRMVQETWQMPGRVEGPGPVAVAPAAAAPPLDVLWIDDDLVVVNKPAGVVVHRGWAQDELPVLQRLRDQLGQRLHAAHRLDRGTSGALIFARSSAIAARLQDQFAAQEVEKRYLALCRGRDAGLTRVDHTLAAEPGAERKAAVTELRLLGASGRYGLFEARPLTGRLHQVRRHLKYASHPIIGDVRYGKGEHNRHFREAFGFGRLALHCRGVAFSHPRTGARIEVEAPLDAGFSAVLSALGIAWSDAPDGASGRVG
jgi:tRNA pseudouridine65 synthase